MKTKREQIKELVIDMLNESHKAMIRNVDKALDSGAVDIDGWDRSNSPMILPKCIIMAILQQESTQYDAWGTGIERRVRKEVRNIRYFL
jgi:hypothetical protein